MTIGIPKALLYWKQPDFWETFFEGLGLKVILSPSTNKEIVENGVRIADPETCFSNKVFWGHILWLEGKGEYIFVPRFKTKKIQSQNSQNGFGGVFEYCPKFFAMPDLAKILVRTPILTETFDEKKEKLERTLERLGMKLNKNKEEIKKATKAAFLKVKELKEKEKEVFLKKIQSPKRKIVLISHPYNLYDEYVNLNIKKKLEELKVEVIFIDEAPTESKYLDLPKFHWEFGEEIMGKIQGILNYKIDGAIEISSFQCGCDAVLKEFVEKKFKQNKIPFLYLLMDEQTGEVGLQTRLEAFIDTL